MDQVALRRVSPRELREHGGDGGTRIWIAHDGIVYDVTECVKWRTGMHEQMHFPGQDLSGELIDAPHGIEVFERPCVRIVGRLVQEP